MSIFRTQTLIKPLTVVWFFLSLTASSIAQGGEPTIISVFGDSISLGYNQNWINTYCGGDPFCPNNRIGNGALNLGTPSVALKAIMEANSRPADVVNLGIGGTASGPSNRPNITSDHGLGRIDGDLQWVESVYGNDKESFALIIYGTNDYGYWIGASTTGFNVGQIAQSALNQGATPIIGTIPPCNPPSGCQSSSAINDVNYYIEAAANQTYSGGQVYFVDQYQNLVNAGWSGLNDDGLHPNDEGYELIAQHWFSEHLKALVAPEITLAPIYMLLLDD